MALNDSQGSANTTPSLTLSPPPPTSTLPSVVLTSSNAASSPPPSSLSSLSPSNSTTTSLTSTASNSDDHLYTTKPRTTEAPPKQRSKNGYVARVGFDTFGCDDTAEYVFTLQARTDHWHRTKTSRTFLVGTDLNEYSSHALQWVMENMVEDGDEIVALRVVPMELRDSFAKYGVPSFQGQERAARTEALKIMDMIREKNKSKEINIVVECLVGNIRDSIQHLIKMYEPAMLVVGTRGRNTVKGFLLGSVSRYCLNHSPVPVTVVRPASKLIKSKNKTKGIFRRRTSVMQLDASPEEEDSQPQLFYSSPLSRQTSRSSLDPTTAESIITSATASARNSAEMDRKRTRSPEPLLLPPAPITAAAKASAAKRPSIFSAATTSSFTPPSPAASITSSLSYASALLSDDAQPTTPSTGHSKTPLSPEGMIKLSKSLTSDGTMSTESSSSNKKVSGRRSFGKLSGAILLGPLSLGGSKDKKRASQS
ncbi:hypothetical protein KVV02_003746 [Mortierella alpina]|uniref:UspA domain-containing protein n=1 Tax=Mortierella alpina TaxID=64518 RepID=A0A9P8D127_MORAP|nr:hypothetical protein KVV02_003746 [Mortierella alpina]